MITYEYTNESSNVALSLGDEVISEYIKDELGAGAALREADPVKWFIGTLAIRNEKPASEVDDMDVFAQTMIQEHTMDPIVYKQVKAYLYSQGFRWTSGCFG